MEKRTPGNEPPFSLDGRISRVFNGATACASLFCHNHCSFSALSLFQRKREEEASTARWWKTEPRVSKGKRVYPFRRNIGGVLAPGTQIIARCSVYRVAKASRNVNRADSRVAETEAFPRSPRRIDLSSCFVYLRFRTCADICACEDRQGERLASPFPGFARHS